MKVSRTFAPPFVRVVVEDLLGGQVPYPLDLTLVQATETCVTIGTLPDVDGETMFSLGPRLEVDTGAEPRFKGQLETPSRHIVVRTMDMDDIVEADVPNEKTTIYVWTNEPAEPDEVYIGFE